MHKSNLSEITHVPKGHWHWSLVALEVVWFALHENGLSNRQTKSWLKRWSAALQGSISSRGGMSVIQNKPCLLNADSAACVCLPRNQYSVWLFQTRLQFFSSSKELTPIVSGFTRITCISTRSLKLLKTVAYQDIEEYCTKWREDKHGGKCGLSSCISRIRLVWEKIHIGWKRESDK